MAVQQEKSASCHFFFCTLEWKSPHRPRSGRRCRCCTFFCVRCNLYLTRVTHLGVCNAMRQQHAVRLSLLVKQPGREGDAVSQASRIVLNNKRSQESVWAALFQCLVLCNLRGKDGKRVAPPSSLCPHTRAAAELSDGKHNTWSHAGRLLHRAAASSRSDSPTLKM